MICPNCKCEYIRGVTQCADCGVALVDGLESPDTNPAADVRIVAIWQGNDPAEYERVKEALESAEIPFTTGPDSKSNSSFLRTESRMEIWVSETDREEARKILLDLQGRVDPDELTPEELESLALPESDQPEDEELGELQDVSKAWNEDDPVAEVWNGDSEAFADSLIVCLREIGISSRKFTEAGHWRVVVRPEQESRAKEIVREVVEASPPE